MLTLKIHNDVSEMTALAPFVEQMGEELGIPMDMIFQIELALDEAVANVVNYAYPGETGREVRLDAETIDGNLIMTLTDQGVPFNPLEEAPDVDTTLGAEERPIGGLGIFLIRNVMDDVMYEYKDASNILTMRKSLSDPNL